MLFRSPRIREAHKVERYKATPTYDDQYGMVDSGSLESESDRHCHTDSGVSFHVTDVVDIQYAYAEGSYGYCGKDENPRRNSVSYNEIRSEDSDDSEEDEYGNVAKSAIAVRVSPEGVFNGPADGCST